MPKKSRKAGTLLAAAQVDTFKLAWQSTRAVSVEAFSAKMDADSSASKFQTHHPCAHRLRQHHLASSCTTIRIATEINRAHNGEHSHHQRPAALSPSSYVPSGPVRLLQSITSHDQSSTISPCVENISPTDPAQDANLRFGTSANLLRQV